MPEEVDAALDFENENLADLNEICHAIEQLSPADREKLGAAISPALPEQAGEDTNLAKNWSCSIAFPACALWRNTAST